jgi:hypothetical protein
MPHRTHRKRSRQRLHHPRRPIHISCSTKHNMEQAKRPHDRGTSPHRGRGITHSLISREIRMAILPTLQAHLLNRLRNGPRTPHAKIPSTHKAAEPIGHKIQNNQSMGNHTQPRLCSTRMLQHNLQNIRKPTKQLHEPKRRILHGLPRRR